MRSLIFIYVKAGSTYGFGHLNRSINLAAYLDKYKLLFMLDGDKKAGSILQNNNIAFRIVKNDRELFSHIEKQEPALLIIDARDTDCDFMQKAVQLTKLLSIDDLGEGSRLATITVNPLPKPPDIDLPKANFEGIQYLALSDKLTKYKTGHRKNKDKPTLLISFGGEDPYNLSTFVYDILYPTANEIEDKKGNKLSFNIKLVLGPLYKAKRDFPCISVIEPIDYDDFCRELADCDVLLTGFGMTVYEALFLGKTVFTLNPSDYHNGLASSCEDIINIGVANKHSKELIKGKLLTHLSGYLKEGRKEYPIAEAIINPSTELCSIVDKTLLLKKDKCPICDSHPYVHLREEWVNYYYCRNCLSFFRSSNYSYTEEYKDDYFTSQYKAQYGKTYLEDKIGINHLNKERLDVIRSLVPRRRQGLFKSAFQSYKGENQGRSKSRMLEIGSAMGFFLEKAAEEGFDTYGVELSSYAVKYARDKLSLSVVEGNFSELSYEALSLGLEDGKETKGSYDIIAAWYFIEHNKDFIEVLKKIMSLLKKGGLLCLSTPNCYGISFLRDKERYIKRIPADHYIEFSPHSLSILLSDLGFETCKIVMKGLHFERIIRNKRLRIALAFLKKPILWLFAKRNRGDTFEIYARKKV